MTQSIVAFLGLGAMGYPMARNLVASGFMVRAWNRTSDKAAALVGAIAVPSPRAAAEGASIAITMLADDAAVESVISGPDGLLAGLGPGSLHIGMSTVSIALTRNLTDRHGRAGLHYVAAPVFGRPDAADKRLLWIVAGGNANDLAACSPVFAALGQGVFPFKMPIHAALAKLAGNFLIAATVEALGEALALGEKAGVEPGRLLEMLTGTLFGSPVVKGYGGRIAQTSFEPAGFRMALGLKDVNLALAAGLELGVPLPLAQLARERIETALTRHRGNLDWSGFATVIREAAGLPPCHLPSGAVG